MDGKKAIMKTGLRKMMDEHDFLAGMLSFCTCQHYLCTRNKVI